MPLYIGIRIKPMSPELHARSLRTLDIFVTSLIEAAATVQALVNFFARALSSGAITMEEAMATGLRESELQGQSFLQILRGKSR